MEARHTEMNWASYILLVAVGCLLGQVLLYGPSIAVLGLAAVWLLAMFLWRLHYTFLLWLLAFPLFSTVPLLQVGMRPIVTFDRLAIAGLGVILLGRTIIMGKRLPSLDKADWMMLIFSLMILYSAISHAQTEYANIGGVINIFFIPFAAYILAKNLIASDKDISYFLCTVILVGIYTSVLGLYEHFTLQDILPSAGGLADRSGWVRINGPYNQDSAFGANVMMSLLALVGGGLNLRVVGKSKPLTKIVSVLALSVMAAALVFNYYRTIWLSTLAGLAVWVLMKKRRIWYLIPVAAICLFIISTYLPDITSSYLFTSRVANIETVEFRKDKFAFAFEKFRQNPFTGIGIFNLYRIEETSTGAHNTYLSLLAEMGAPGFGVFTMLILLFSFQAYKNYVSHPSPVRRRFAGIFLCGMTGYLMLGMALLTGYSPEINNLFFALAGVAASKAPLDRTLAAHLSSYT